VSAIFSSIFATDVAKVVSALSTGHVVAAVSQANGDLASGATLEVHTSNKAFRDHGVESRVVESLQITLILHAVFFVLGAEVVLPEEQRLEVVNIQLFTTPACRKIVVKHSPQRLGELAFDAFAADQFAVCRCLSGGVGLLFGPCKITGVVVFLCAGTTFPETYALLLVELKSLLLESRLVLGCGCGHHLWHLRSYGCSGVVVGLSGFDG
jgi:hypothetical protein